MINKSLKALACLAGFSIPAYFVTKWQQESIDYWREMAKKNEALFYMMNQWTRLKQDGKGLEEYFIKYGYKKIAIYGMGMMGQMLARELKESEIEVVYGIDRNSNNIYADVKVVTMNRKLNQVDAVVVTVVKDFCAIREALLKKMDCQVIAIEDILSQF